MSHITLKDIAERAGVTTMTVSRALRNQGRVSEKTAKRIQRIAEDLGYVPDPRMAELMSHMRERRHKPGTEPVIAYLSTEHRADDAPAFPAFFSGARKAAAELGYKLDPFDYWDPSISDQRMSDILIARGIEGVMIPPIPLEVGQLNLDWPRFAAVAFGSTPIRPELDRVLNDHYHNTLTALHRLQEDGVTSAGILLGDAISQRLDHQVQAACHVFTHLPESRMKVRIFLAEKPAPLKKALKHGDLDVLIGTDVHPLFPLDGLPWCSLLLNTRDKGVRGINIRADLAGEAALRFLAGLLQQRKLGLPEHPLQLMVKGEWTEPSG
jgi:LacI family transcriptional regulator